MEILAGIVALLLLIFWVQWILSQVSGGIRKIPAVKRWLARMEAETERAQNDRKALPR